MKKIREFPLCIGLFLCSILFGLPAYAGAVKQSKTAKQSQMKQKDIYFAGGCFWGTEHFFKQIRGVVNTQVGYANGNTASPTYEQVCSKKTGFTETVKVVYDPAVIGLDKLLVLFFKTIDPTSLNRQGNDVGTQYRSGVYYTNAADASVVAEALRNLASQYRAPIVVENMKLKNFYPTTTME